MNRTHCQAIFEVAAVILIDHIDRIADRDGVDRAGGQA